MLCSSARMRQNFYLIFGITIGLIFSLIVGPLFEASCLFTVSILKSNSISIINDEYEPRINLAGKPQRAQKAPQTLLRPRYYSTELGIREKLFIGVLASQTTVDGLAVAVNKTVTHWVDKIVFFVDATAEHKINVSRMKIPSIVGFTDSRTVLKPFHMIKYIVDNYLDEYDFFMLMRDNTYLKADKLMDLVKHVSVSEDVYASGTVIGTNYCSLDAGILLSNSVIHKLIPNVDWCVKNAYSNSDDDNFGRCVLHTLNLPCQTSIQNHVVNSYHLWEASDLKRIIDQPDQQRSFEQALTIYPMLNADDMYKIHLAFCKMHLDKANINIKELRKSIVTESILEPPGFGKVSWPVGSQPGNTPISRFDVLKWDYFSETHLYLDSRLSNVRLLNKAEYSDIQNVLNTSIEHLVIKYSGKLRFDQMVNGYKKFDPSRGLDYILDLNFWDLLENKLVQKRVEISKTLGKVEMLPVPYVTENTRIHILLPVHSYEKDDAFQFLKQYKQVCVDKKEKTMLMFVLLYDSNSPGKGTADDVFKILKDEATLLSNAHKKDGTKVAWLSVRVPNTKMVVLKDALLDFAVIDLAIKKFPSDALMMLARPKMEIRQDYLNRVRMNTIMEWQIFSPIPFSEYDPTIMTQPRLLMNLDINKMYGHFDPLNYEHLSFYAKDYVTARKRAESIVPIVRVDRDIHRLVSEFTSQSFMSVNITSPSVFAMFVLYSECHMFRAVESGLRLRNKQKLCELYENSIVDHVSATLYGDCLRSRNRNSGSKGNLAKLVLDFQNET
ncbi:chondroitin sulfate synthase 2 [Daktulosphaira vitifoliae]|uniref:chondroitin sulfate synthase 2 n=1 Tax=Daktulosphaira vitifoliae TaxID=58002 RepID=UPI0021AA70A4|nr:chondroitin sulfate synthase 2 [Daktulosphaira vitifoliae]